MQSKRLTTRQLTTIAILAAISAVLFMVEIPIVLFYKLDFSNLPWCCWEPSPWGRGLPPSFC